MRPWEAFKETDIMVIYKNSQYKITLKEPVSTIPDECKGVGCEIGTHPKRKTIER